MQNLQNKKSSRGVFGRYEKPTDCPDMIMIQINLSINVSLLVIITQVYKHGLTKKVSELILTCNKHCFL